MSPGGVGAREETGSGAPVGSRVASIRRPSSLETISTRKGVDSAPRVIDTDRLPPIPSANVARAPAPGLLLMTVDTSGRPISPRSTSIAPLSRSTTETKAVDPYPASTTANPARSPLEDNVPKNHFFSWGYCKGESRGVRSMVPKAPA
jgi:hypothetical protein